MKVLWVAGEATNWAVGYCRELAELGNEILLIGNSEDLYDKENMDCGKVKVKLIPLSDFNAGYIVKIATDEKFAPNVIFGSHVNTIFPVYMAAQKMKIPWGSMVLDIPSDLLKCERRRMKLWNAYFDVLRQADQIIFNTEVARDEFFKFTNNYINDKNVITYASNIPEEYLTKKINLKPNNYIVSVCRLTKIKNCNIIPIALSMIKDKPKYIAIGRDGGDLKDIKVLCEKIGIEFEHKPDVSEKEKFELIYNAKALIYPQASEYIGGLSPFEAMSVGTPAIVGDYKILKDLYDVNAYYFNKTADLAQITALMCNLDKDNPFNWSKYDLAKRFALKNNYARMAIKINDVLEGMK